MKVGMVFECGPQGADKKVCELLLKQLQPDVEIISITLDNKKSLITKCGTVSAQLFEEGCDRVLIIWDLYPAWRTRNHPPCRKEDREAIFDALKSIKVAVNRVYLICIKEELEAWLLADERALSNVLSKPTYPANVDRVKNPERTQNPKKRLNQIFQEQSGRPYSDLIHAEKIIQAMPDLKRIKRCSSFVRFVLKATDQEI